MNVNDLRNVLADHAETAADTSVDTRITGSLTQARSIRRRRRAATAIGIAAVAAAMVVVPTLVTSPDTQPQPAVDLDENGFRLFADGRELVDSVAIEPGEQSVDLTVTPTAFPLALVTECSGDPTIEISVNGEPFSGGSCRGFTSADESTWADRGVHAGEAATFTMSAADVIGENERLAIAAYQDVPWSEYTFPARPDTLPELWPDDLGEPDVVLWSDPADPNASRQISVDYEWLSIQVLSQTPGIIRLRVNGEDQAPLFFWDYPYTNDLLLPARDPDNWPLEPLETPVEIEVHPEGFTGEWRLHVIECTRAGACGW